MKNILACVFCLLALAGSSIAGDALSTQSNDAAYDQAEIYYTDWYMTTIAALSPDDVRSGWSIKITVKGQEETAKLVRWARFDDMQADPENQDLGDVRLVIDLFKGGERTSYNANQFYLMSKDGQKRRKLTPAFRAKLAMFDKPCIGKMSYEDLITLQYGNANIYFAGWSDSWDEDVLTPEQVREKGFLFIQLRNSIRTDLFMDWAALNKELEVEKNMDKLDSQPWRKNVRLVVDVSAEEGSTKSYYANNISISTGDYSGFRIISDVFLSKFMLFDAP
ncbi:hypothetical protein [Desulfatibacillum aliphaticivorans]|uniref:hypothetical protein n=1 Tax=Desulfatibacillum aliphaticivorans TaxID=218208 RepID=UPI0004180B9B|nr:hypothetical protein [Desulfatibacillum aliphaticivorans]